MNLKKLEFGSVAPEDVCIGLDDRHAYVKPRHFHPYWELKVYEFEGRVRVVMTPPGEVHGKTPFEALVNGWVLHFQEPMLNLSFVKKSLDGMIDHFFPWAEVDVICPGGAIGLINAIVRAKEKNADVRVLNALFETLWAAVFQIWRKVGNKPVLKSSLVNIARCYIERNYYLPDLSVENVASHFGVTAGYLANRFKRDGLITVRQYIVKVRINHALRLLRSGKYTVKEVADMTGWNCQFYFSNCFRRYFKVPPSQASTLIEDNVLGEDFTVNSVGAASQP